MTAFCIAASGNWQVAGAIFFGILLGALLAITGFTDAGRVKAAFKFADKTLLLTFLATLFFSIVLAQIAVYANWIIMPRATQHFLWGSIVGGALCGIGMALSGLAPLSAIGSLASGKFTALWTIAGMVLAIVIYRLWSTNFNALLAKWDSPVGVVPMTLEFFNAANPALWFAGGLAILILIVQIAVKGK